MLRYLKRGKDVQVRAADDAKVRDTVESIIQDIELRGDEAVHHFSRQFDNWDPADFRLATADIEAARKSLSDLGRRKARIGPGEGSSCRIGSPIAQLWGKKTVRNGPLRSIRSRRSPSPTGS